MSACVLKGWNSVCLSSGVRVDPVIFFFFWPPSSGDRRKKRNRLHMK